MAQRKHMRRRKLELYSKFLIPIPVGFLAPFAIMLTLDQAKDPDPFPLLSILLGVGFLALPTALFQVLIGLPTIATLRGKSLLAHLLTGAAYRYLWSYRKGSAISHPKWLDR